MSHCHLLPMRLIGLLYPTIAIPAGDDFPEACLATEASLQGTQIVHREGWCELVEDGVIAAVSDALVAGIHKLTLQHLAKGLYLLLQTILGHHHCKVETRLGFLILARKQMKNHTATETNDGRTLTIDILHVIDVLGCLHTFLLYPSLNGL